MNWQLDKLKLVMLFMVTIGMILLYMGACTNDDHSIEPPVISGKDLVSVKVTSPPVLDGVIDAQWEKSPKLEFEAIVPDPSGDIFRGYIGNVIPTITLRSAYDDENIYFLAEWADPTESLQRQPWCFDPVTKLWKQESGTPVFTSPTRPAFYEDKVAMLWNIDHSVSGWNSGTCYKSCHTGLGVTDGHGRHYTNNSFERIDMWHWKSVRGGLNMNQFDDQYQDNTFPNGRKSDASTGGGYSDNTQKLAITGSSPEVLVNVPKYLIPNRSKYYWIMGSEVTDGTAKLITGVDENGVLTYDGGTIDPNADAEYQRKGNGIGDKAIAGIIVSPFTGSRGDIACKAEYTGSGWVLEYQRALTTTDTERKDIDFSSLDDQYFGFAVFENAQIAHAIKPNLLLKFQK